VRLGWLGFLRATPMNKASEWARRIQFFRPAEFDSPDEIGSGLEHMRLSFVDKLDRLRVKARIRVHINSGYRTNARNIAAGGIRNSAHCFGRAADIATPTSKEKFAVVKAAVKIGFRRIGVGKNFVHVDDDETKPQDVMW